MSALLNVKAEPHKYHSEKPVKSGPRCRWLWNAVDRGGTESFAKPSTQKVSFPFFCWSNLDCDISTQPS